MTTTPAPEILVTRRYACSTERVFDAWLDPRSAGRWLFATPTGIMRKVEIDPFVGGGFTIVERRSGVDVEHAGTYLEMIRPRRIVFTFTVDIKAKTPTRVSIDVERFGSGCEVVLKHQGVPPEYTDRTRAGWMTILDALAIVLGEKMLGGPTK
ncbi:MAG: SRPBCC domain-containing protein [Pyrinomonadaceae bacterium]|nr:SRPBCC domain-containing protein [Phycisphaerales bacterium]